MKEEEFETSRTMGGKSYEALLQELRTKNLHNEKIRKRRLIENFNLYAIHVSLNNYLPAFTKGKRERLKTGAFWKKTMASLLVYDEVLSEDNIEIRLCDTF